MAGKLTFWTGITSLVQNAGAFFGIYAFSRITHLIGRKPAFAISFVLAALSTAITFWFLDSFWQIFVLIPIMGFCQLALFGGYAIYFPELFPTRLRSTGTSFCYNVGRLVAAAGPLTLGLLTSKVFDGYPDPMPLRLAGVAMCSVFLIGLLALPSHPRPAASRCRNERSCYAGRMSSTVLQWVRRQFHAADERVAQGLLVELDTAGSRQSPWPRNPRTPSRARSRSPQWRIAVPEA